MKEKTKLITLEGTSTLSNRQLVEAVEGLLKNAFPPIDFELTQKPRVQVAQGPRKGK